MKNIQEKSWVSQWSGQYSILSASIPACLYASSIKEKLGTKLNNVIVLLKKDTATCYFDKDELLSFGEELKKQVEKNPKVIESWCTELKDASDKYMEVIKQANNNPLKKEEIKDIFDKLLQALKVYTAPHMAIKKSPDFLDPVLLKKYLPLFDDARSYSEKVYDNFDTFLKKLVAILDETKVEQLQSLTYKEFLSFLQGTTTFPKDTSSRWEDAAMLITDGNIEVKTGEEATIIKNTLLKINKQDLITGTSVFPGKVTGKAKIVLDPNSASHFQKGDILVTTMTRPAYLPLMEKASAVITDVGGMLCHAAVTARELKIPCIVGTEHATKIIENDQELIVDAEKGEIRIL